MSDEKRLKARVAHKHKTRDEWFLDVYDAATDQKRSNPFIPLDGELIIFDADDKYEKRFKFGDGVTDVWDLPFFEPANGFDFVISERNEVPQYEMGYFDKWRKQSITELLADKYGKVYVTIPYDYDEDGNYIIVPEAITVIEFAKNTLNTDVDVTISGSGTGCQVIRNATIVWGGYIEGFKGGVEHCHAKSGVGWNIKNCDNISHCDVSGLTDCNNINDCTIFSAANQITIFSNCHYINNLIIDDAPSEAYYFDNCSHLSNIVVKNSWEDLTFNYSGCTYVDPYTCAGFIPDEDVGKVRILTKDGSYQAKDADGWDHIIKTEEEFENIGELTGRILVADGCKLNKAHQVTLHADATELRFEGDNSGKYDDPYWNGGQSVDIKITATGHTRLTGCDLRKIVDWGHIETPKPESQTYPRFEFIGFEEVANCYRMGDPGTPGDGSWTMTIHLTNCQNVHDCVVESMKNCHDISSIWMYRYSYFENCTKMSNVEILYDGWWSTPYFTNCSYISNVILSGFQDHWYYAEDGTPENIAYENCHFVDANTCEGIITPNDNGKLLALNHQGKLETVELAQHLTSITYDDLVTLRNNSQLVPGTFYRIINYECTSSDENTTCGNHYFDIIVQAQSSNTLSEDASAAAHMGKYPYLYTGTIKDEYLANSGEEERLEPYSVTIEYNEYLDGHAYGTPEDTIHKDVFIGYEYVDGVLVLYKTDASGIPGTEDYDEAYAEPDTMDMFYYVGPATSPAGEECDVWRKHELTDEGNYTLTGAEQYIYTNKIVNEPNVVKSISSVGNSINYAAWELKYCLDNDISRFAWADEGSGKGVIYYMKDEWNNECPYDFKNILFSRDDAWFASHKDFRNEYPTDALNPGYYYTFSLILNDPNMVELTTWQAGLNDVHSASRMVNNQIGVCYNQDKVQILNNNIFIDYYDGRNLAASSDNTLLQNCSNNTFGRSACNNQFEYGCSNNTLGASCSNNVLGNYCYNNIFGNKCIFNNIGGSSKSNIFGNYCEKNTLGVNCVDNIFGNQCSNNIFGNDCGDNRFYENCSKNIFGSGCEYNDFKQDCWHNIFSEYCGGNAFGEACIDNIFETSCINNIFGNDCSNNTFKCYCRENTLEGDSNYNTFGRECNNITMAGAGNNFGDWCSFIELISGCYDNIFESYCSNLTLDSSCSYNKFGVNCSNIILREESEYNTFGMNCSYIEIEGYRNEFDCGVYNVNGYGWSNNKIGAQSHDIGNERDLGINVMSCTMIGADCYDLHLEGDVDRCSFGPQCRDIRASYGLYDCSFGAEISDVTCGGEQHKLSVGSGCNNIIFETDYEKNNHACYSNNIQIAPNNSYITIYGSSYEENDSQIRNVIIGPGINGTASTPKAITLKRGAAPVVYEAPNTTHIILD